ncbi:PAS domain S-box protein [Erythrobacter arachoides]|uniref:histidine kinase n=2 Tax=Aurantiacibacter arachoides TaxID=1850444 RepID=A0A845A2R1_9SPHN|nr:hybrid sensor histidine kinase/response regulator [Aurantiacibacter arachoides]MXO93890.1 PAS domain S-box protein [Aurantiacibacter arachoides]
MLGESGIAARTVNSLTELVAELGDETGFVVVTEEAIATADLRPLSAWLAQQEEWSDLPFILLTNQGGGLERNPAAARHLAFLGNVTFLERPFHPTTFVSLARAAVRGRRRQYDARARLVSLREGEEKYRTLFESIEAGFCVAEVNQADDQGRIDYRIIEANPAFYRQSGFTEDIIGNWLREATPMLEEHWYQTYGHVAATGEPRRFESGSDALGRWFDVYAFRVSDADSQRIAILFNDISARRLAEQRLRELNDTLEQQVAARAAERDRLWNLSQDMLARADYSGMMSAVSPAWTDVLGWSEQDLLSRGYASFMHPEDEAATLAAIGTMEETRQPARFENRIATSDGGWKSIEWTVAPEPDGVNFIAVGRDLSLAKAREAELDAARDALRQSQKMEAMGSLTGGVAHDFNNLLTPIVGSLDMLKRKGVGNEREQRLIDGAIQSADRARTLVQRLLAFARRQPLQAVAVDVVQLVENMAGLIESTTGPKIKVSVDAEAAVPPATADPNQLEMALLNLAVNARDAMPDGGVLRIGASFERAGSDEIADLKVGDYVRLSVSDTGTGMDPETLRRAVEPFFSTKGIGKGTGLGLSMVHGLAAQLGGTLTIESQPGEGTEIALWLPVSATPTVVKPEEPKASERAGRGIALVVDDEFLVRFSTADMLSDMGYEVVEAGSGEEALQLIAQGLEPILLVTDHLMPGITGTELVTEVRSRLPTIQVLIVSGYADLEGLPSDVARLTKPFRADELESMLAVTASTVGQP